MDDPCPCTTKPTAGLLAKADTFPACPTGAPGPGPPPPPTDGCKECCNNQAMPQKFDIVITATRPNGNEPFACPSLINRVFSASRCGGDCPPKWWLLCLIDEVFPIFLVAPPNPNLGLIRFFCAVRFDIGCNLDSITKKNFLLLNIDYGIASIGNPLSNEPNLAGLCLACDDPRLQTPPGQFFPVAGWSKHTAGGLRVDYDCRRPITQVFNNICIPRMFDSVTQWGNLIGWLAPGPTLFPEGCCCNGFCLDATISE